MASPLLCYQACARLSRQELGSIFLRRGIHLTPSRRSSPESADQTSPQVQTQSFPLYPSVNQLLHEHGLTEAEVAKIPASGPNGRLLKGDVLAYLGTIDASYPAEQAKRITALTYLNIGSPETKTAKQAESTSQPGGDSVTVNGKAPRNVLETLTSVTADISFQAVRKLQTRLGEVFGIEVPLETFVARAVDLSNADLPKYANEKLNSKELFESILGSGRISNRTINGHFRPQIIVIPAQSKACSHRLKPSEDIIDALIGDPKALGATRKASKHRNLENDRLVIGLKIVKEEERRAKLFLERMRTILQVEPGRLVL